MDESKTLTPFGKINKKWEDLTEVEKIDRLKQVLLDNRYLVSRVVELEQKIHRIELHTHDTSGECVVRLERVRNTGYGGSVMSVDPLA